MQKIISHNNKGKQQKKVRKNKRKGGIFTEGILPKEKTSHIQDCIGYEFQYIHTYDDFNDLIRDYYIDMFSEQLKRNFENTCEYMFNVVGYGIFVFIKDNNVHSFIPFANIYREKPESEKIIYQELDTYLEKKTKALQLQDKMFHRIAKSREQWAFSDCIMFYWNDWWKDIELYMNIYYNMLQDVCKNRKIQDTCFFINLFDQPVLNKRECKIFIGAEEKCSNNSTHKQNPFIPVLSGATSMNHYDKCIVYADAWEVATQLKFLPSCRDWYYKKNITTNWDKKQSKITFRGRNSSCYANDPLKNTRIRVIKYLNANSKLFTEMGIEYDIGLSGFTSQTLFVDDKLIYSNPEQIKEQVGDLIQAKTMEEQSKSKFILDIDGYVTPWRLFFELSYSSIIILIMSKYKSWFYDELKDNENIVIIQDNNIDNIITRINETKEKKEIASKSRELFEKISSKEYIYTYMQNMLNSEDFTFLNIP